MFKLRRDHPEPKKVEAPTCATCKYFEQGTNCSFCGHPEQPTEGYKNIVYYTFSCNLHVKGIAKSRVKFMDSIKNK